MLRNESYTVARGIDQHREITVIRATVFFLLLVVGATLNPMSAVSAEGNELRIAMILWRGETKAEQGFKDGLKELGYSVRYTVMNADQDRGKLGHLLREDLEPNLSEFHYIYTFGTTVTRSTQLIVRDRVPQVFDIVAAPMKAGIVRTMQSSDHNISGVSNAIPLSAQIQTALRAIKLNRLGLIFNPREKNSMAIREELRTVAARFGIELVDLRSPPSSDVLLRNLERLNDKSVVMDAVYLPQDSFIVSKAALIGNSLRVGKVKSIGSIKEYIDKGALMGIVPDFYKLGRAWPSL
jgi:putative ABC transport system substrate-binding protein